MQAAVAFSQIKAVLLDSTCMTWGTGRKLLHSESLTWEGCEMPASWASLADLTRGEDAGPPALHLQPHLPIPPAGYLTALGTGLRWCSCT